MNRKIILVLTVGVLTISCSGEQNTDGLVAMVDNYTLSIDDAVDLLVDEERLAADAGVVKAVAELWLNYTLLAEATATDSMTMSLPNLVWGRPFREEGKKKTTCVKLRRARWPVARR